MNGKRIAIVHDWFDRPGGAEKVVEALLELFPEADLFALVDFFSKENRERYLHNKRVETSFLQRLPGARKGFRNYLPLFPTAIESLDLSGYDCIISSSWAVAKGVQKTSGQYHLSYCHTPIRYAWDLCEEYTEELPPVKKQLVQATLAYLRRWDRRSASQVDCFLANSRYVAGRIARSYGRSARVLYPPVEIERFTLHTGKRFNYYLTASRLVPYKKTRLIVDAFNRMPGKHLKVVGEGEEYERLRNLAGPNVEILGYRPEKELIKLMQQARAFVYAALEDFGIVPVEAMACGTPVIALGQGGTAETVVEGETGILFPTQNVKAIINAVRRFEVESFRPEAVRIRAEHFSRSRFLKEMEEIMTIAAPRS